MRAKTRTDEIEGSCARGATAQTGRSVMRTPETIIAEYLDHLEAEPYVDEAVAQHGVPNLLAEVVRFTKTIDPVRVGQALLFVRDASIGVFRTQLTESFRNELPGSGLFDALEACLRAPHFSVRADAVYTYGKLSFSENTARLIRALETRQETDPFLIGRLLFEIRWLERRADAHWSRIHVLSASRAELSRWAALAFACKSPNDELELTHALELAASFQRDESDLIRREAIYLGAALERSARHRNLNKAERRKRRADDKEEKNRIETLRPAISFAQLEQRFTAARSEPDYTVADVL
jgi:hypothetical protein